MSKVRHVDLYPSEWLAGTRGLLTRAQHGVYDVVVFMILDRTGTCPNDAAFVAGHFKVGPRETWPSLVRATRDDLDRLIELGKLRVSADGQWLSNGRADRDLKRGNERIDDAAKAGRASGAARRSRRPPVPPTSQLRASYVPATSPPPVSNHTNGLARTVVPNHQPPTDRLVGGSLTDPAREAELAGKARPAHGDSPGPSRTPRPIPPFPGTTPSVPPDPAVVETFIRDLGVDPAAVTTPPPPAALVAPTPPQDDPKALLLEKAKAARRKLMDDG